MIDIEKHLKRLKRQHWLPTLTLLIHNFEGAISDPRNDIKDGILEVLKSLTTDDDNKNDTLGIMRFQKMFCFRYRAYKGKPAIYWDPTQQSFKDFAGKEEVNIYEGHDSHPVSDILMRWMAERFKKQLN